MNFPHYSVMEVLYAIHTGKKFEIVDDKLMTVLLNDGRAFVVDPDYLDYLYDKEWIENPDPDSVVLTGNGKYWLNRWLVATKRHPPAKRD